MYVPLLRVFSESSQAWPSEYLWGFGFPIHPNQLDGMRPVDPTTIQGSSGPKDAI